MYNKNIMYIDSIMMYIDGSCQSRSVHYLILRFSLLYYFNLVSPAYKLDIAWYSDSSGRRSVAVCTGAEKEKGRR